jgi:hypothetical protein
MSMFDYSAVQRNAAMLMPELQAETLRQQLGVEQLQSVRLGNVAAEQEMQARQVAAQEARQRVGQRDLALQQFQTRPTHQGALSLITSFPELREPITEAWKLREDAQNQSDLRFLGTTRALLMGGRVDDAIAQAEQRIRIDRKAGDDVSEDEAMVKLMRDNPSLAAVQMTGLIGAIVGPEKLADTVAKLNEDDRAGALFPAQRRRAVAEASKAETEATYAPQVIQSNLLNDEANRRNVDSQITTRAAQVEIARDTLTTNVELKLQEMEAAGARPDPGSVQIMNNAVVSGASNTALAQQTRTLADEFSASPARGGAFIGEATIPISGTTNPSGSAFKLMRFLAPMAVKFSGIPLVGPAIDVASGLVKQAKATAEASRTLAGMTSYGAEEAARETAGRASRGAAAARTGDAEADERAAGFIDALVDVATAGRLAAAVVASTPRADER